MNQFRRSSSFVALLVAVGCQSGAGPTEPPAPVMVAPSGTTVPFTRLREEPYSFTYYSGMRESQRLVVRDAASWRRVWTQIVGSLRPAPEPPPIDFSKEMVVVAAHGERTTGGYSILIESATMTDDGLFIGIRTTSPGRGCAVTAAFSQPVDVARFPSTSGAVHFVEGPVVTDCQ